jgi:NAD-dependent SIR2 family protein deacetylase
MISRNKDIIFLLGAGASAEADIPPSGKMVQQIEELLRNDAEWKDFLPLYHHIKSAIHYAAGLKGQFGDEVPYNIETLVNTLYELERNEQHPLYPFIASWNSRLVALAESDFSKVKSFRRLILKRLKKWMSPNDPSQADYFHGFVRLQKDLNLSLRVFSLNYDLCVERLNSANFRVETGFAGVGTKHAWDWERFEHNESGPPPPEVYLYKLHGSINWRRDKQSKELFSFEQTEGIEPEDLEVIFGRDFKLEAADPYLFYAYAFRMFTLDARLVVSIGYGFGDGHINKMLAQALKADAERHLLVIAKCDDAEDKACRQMEITGKLEAGKDQIVVHEGTAKQYLEKLNLKDDLIALLPKSPDAPF